MPTPSQRTLIDKFSEAQFNREVANMRRKEEPMPKKKKKAKGKKKKSKKTKKRKK